MNVVFMKSKSLLFRYRVDNLIASFPFTQSCIGSEDVYCNIMRGDSIGSSGILPLTPLTKALSLRPTIKYHNPGPKYKEYKATSYKPAGAYSSKSDCPYFMYTMLLIWSKLKRLIRAKWTNIYVRWWIGINLVHGSYIRQNQRNRQILTKIWW